MKKQLVIIGIIVLLVCVGLSGCQIQSCPDPSENKPIAIGCIKQNPEIYLNKSVIIKATFGKRNDSIWITTPSIHYANVPDSLDINISSGINTSILIPWEEYYFYGIVKEFEAEHTGLGPFYLEVTNVSEDTSADPHIVLFVILTTVGVVLIIGLSFITYRAVKNKRKQDTKSKKLTDDRHCPNCGRVIPLDARTCPYCAKNFW